MKEQTMLKGDIKQPVSLIIGVNGFIGKHLADALIKQGHKVAGVPRHLLIDPINLKRYIKMAQPDYVFHLAAYGNHSNQTDDNETFVTNLVKTQFLLEALKDLPIQKFINFSTSSVYGNSIDTGGMYESDLPDPRTYYAATKLGAEHLVKAWSLKYKKKAVSIRPFSVYGEGEADFRFIPTIIRSLNNEEPMKLIANPTHDWIYIDDFIDAVLLVVTKDQDGVEEGGVVNIGTGIATTNEKVLEILESISKKKANIMIRDTSPSHTVWKAFQPMFLDYEWQPKYSLKKGLKRTYDWYTKNSNNGNTK